MAICFLLGNWSGLDREKAKDYIIKCQVCKACMPCLVCLIIQVANICSYCVSEILLRCAYKCCPCSHMMVVLGWFLVRNHMVSGHNCVWSWHLLDLQRIEFFLSSFFPQINKLLFVSLVVFNGFWSTYLFQFLLLGVIVLDCFFSF